MSGETKQRISELEAEIVRLKEAQPTLRDQFAMAALNAVYNELRNHSVMHIVEITYVVADAMMEVRDVKD